MSLQTRSTAWPLESNTGQHVCQYIHVPVEQTGRRTFRRTALAKLMLSWPARMRVSLYDRSVGVCENAEVDDITTTAAKETMAFIVVLLPFHRREIVQSRRHAPLHARRHAARAAPTFPSQSGPQKMTQSPRQFWSIERWTRGRSDRLTLRVAGTF